MKLPSKDFKSHVSLHLLHSLHDIYLFCIECFVLAGQNNEPKNQTVNMNFCLHQNQGHNSWGATAPPAANFLAMLYG